MGRNKNDSVTQLENYGKIVTGDHCMVEHFLKNFSNIGTSVLGGFTNDKIYAQFLTENLSYESFTFCEVLLFELYIIMGGLNSTGAERSCPTSDIEQSKPP